MTHRPERWWQRHPFLCGMLATTALILATLAVMPIIIVITRWWWSLWLN